MMSQAAEKRCHKRSKKQPKNDIIHGQKYVQTAEKRCHNVRKTIRGTLRALYRSYVLLFEWKLFSNPRNFSEDLQNYGICEFPHFPRIYEIEEILRFPNFPRITRLCGFPHKCGLLEALLIT